MYLVKTPWWLRSLYPTLTWRLPAQHKVLYLTFDDGPHPEATPFVLEQLKAYNAKGTFFCIGNNVVAHPNIFAQVLQQGHAVGNHTYNHANGWNTDNTAYLDEVQRAGELIHSNLFRPPYGRIKRSQAAALKTNYKVIMWDVLSADFDIKLTGRQCSRYVTKHAGPGSIVVFHDSQKALPRLKVALPLVLEYFTQKGFCFEAIPSRYI